MNSPHENDESPEKRMQQYLDEITGHVAPERRAEWREEVRQHIEAMIAAEQELGHSYSEAVDAALATFGSPQIIGKQVERETSCCVSPIVHPVWQGMTHFLLAAIPGFITLGVVAAVFTIYGGEEYLKNIGTLASALSITTPIFGGWVVGRKVQSERPIREIFLSTTLGVLAALPMAMTMSVLHHQTNWKPDIQEMALWFFSAQGFALLSWWLCSRKDIQKLASA